MSIHVKLLGPLEVEVSGSALALPARKTEALLAILALRPGVAFEREWLAAILWPDVPEAQGRTSLRQAVGHLRKQLSESFVVSSSTKLHLDPRAATFDTAEFERALNLPARDRAELTTLWRGELLEAFPAVSDPFADVLSKERARLLERMLTRSEECMAALSALSEEQRALEIGTRLIEIEPTRESVYRALMRLHAERGERAAALRLYERCAESLDRALGISPSAETEALYAELRSLRRATPTPPRETSETYRTSDSPSDPRIKLVVLPFRASSNDSTSQLLAEGLTDDVRTELSRFRQLAVVAPPSVTALASAEPNESEIAKRTGAKLVFSGSVRVVSDRARVTAALLDPTTSLQLWAERWDVQHASLFEVLDRLTQSVVSALALQIDESRLSEARRRSRQDLEAYECWLRGLECLRRGSPESDDEARSFFEQALRLVPSFARAYAGISLSHFNDWSCQAWDRWDERERLAFENASRAVALDDGDHVTHCILGRIYIYRREFELGARHLEQAIALNANDADILMHSATGFSQLGRPEQALQLSQAALRLNSKHADWYYACAAFSHFVARDVEACRALARRAPDCLVDTRAMLASACAHLGALDEAREHLRRFRDHFQIKIIKQHAPAPGEALNWLLHVNPFARATDAEFFVTGLERAGLHE